MQCTSELFFEGSSWMQIEATERQVWSTENFQVQAMSIISLLQLGISIDSGPPPPPSISIMQYCLIIKDEGGGRKQVEWMRGKSEGRM